MSFSTRTGVIPTHTHVNTCVYSHIRTRIDQWNSRTFRFPAPQRACDWLTPGTPALRRVTREDCCRFEASIGYMVKDQASQIHSKTFPDKQSNVVVHACNPSTGDMEAGRLSSWAT